MPESNSSPLVDTPLRLFDAFGLEIEHMIVDGERHDLPPTPDQQNHSVSGKKTHELNKGANACNK